MGSAITLFKQRLLGFLVFFIKFCFALVGILDNSLSCPKSFQDILEFHMPWSLKARSYFPPTSSNPLLSVNGILATGQEFGERGREADQHVGEQAAAPQPTSNINQKSAL